jgi:hypothetical protein
MTGPGDTRTEPLGIALADILRRPVTNLLGVWNWKAASISVLIRATVFFTTNLRSGRSSALRASLVEAAFAIFAAGLLAAVTQRVRHAQPVWATALFVWLGVPAMLLCIQTTVHTLGGTPHMRTGLIISFCMAAFGSGFNWYAQRRGVLVTGPDSAGGDLQALPGVLRDFLLAAPRALFTRTTP